MDELENTLRDALSVEPGSLDAARLRAGVARRLSARRRRRWVAGLGTIAVAVGIAAVLRTTSVELAHDQPEHRTVQGRRPAFARFYERAPLRSLAVLSRQIGEIQASLDRSDGGDAARGDLLIRLGEAFDEQRELAPRGSGERAEATELALHNLGAVYDGARFRTHRDRDRALFDAGYLLYDEARVPEALVLFQRLLDDHPMSSHAAEAAVAKAEAYFDDGDLASALQYYECVDTFPASPLFGYALFKVGWVKVNQKDTDGAMKAFERVVELGRKGKLGGDRELVAESKKALERLRQPMGN